MLDKFISLSLIHRALAINYFVYLIIVKNVIGNNFFFPSAISITPH